MTVTRPLLTGASAASMASAFGKFGSRIAFAPDGDGRPQEQVAAAMAKKREEEKGDSAKKDGAKPDAAKKDAAKADGDEKKPEDKMDRLLSMMDSIGSRLDATNARMDAMDEKAKADAAARADAAKADKAKSDDMSMPGKDEREVSERQSETENKQEGERDKMGVGDAAKKDAARKDEDADDIERKKREAKDDTAKADKARADAIDLSRYDREIDAIKARMPRVLTDAEEQQFASAQAKADGAYSLHGKRAPAPMMGESLMAYRLRTTREIQKFSPTLKSADLTRIAAADPSTYDVLEAQIYNDSAVAANNPMDIERGDLRMRTTRDITGRNMNTFHGPDTFVKAMRPPMMKYVKTFNTAAGRA